MSTGVLNSRGARQVPGRNFGESCVAYAISGSDSSGGAGLEADLPSFASFGVHGCTVCTALTIQNRKGVQGILPTPVGHLQQQFRALLDDIAPQAVKLGMLGNSATVTALEPFLQELASRPTRVPLVCDPVLAASAGGALMDRGGSAALRALYPYLSLITPNCDEAEVLTGIKISTFVDMEQAAEALLDQGVESVLLTGGHLNLGDGWTYDYFVSRAELPHPAAFWIRGERIVTEHSHGTGCTLSAAITAALARGFELADALVLAKMVVTQGLREARVLAGGAGAVAHTGWPEGLHNLPSILPCRPDLFEAPQFSRCGTEHLGLYPVVNSLAWLERLLAEGVTTLQLRIKDPTAVGLRALVHKAVALQRRYGARLFINDHWQLAIEEGAYGVHLGQEDIDSADYMAIARSGTRLGLSNHAWYELARSHALVPSYMAIGPIYATPTKQMRFASQGVEQLGEWVQLLSGTYPVTAIGGIDLQRAPAVARTGVGSIAVVRAITEAPNYRQAVADFRRVLSISDNSVLQELQ